jgi:16S rRNA (uracil1498-N3)-methyltransferase
MARFFIPGTSIRDKRGTLAGAELEHLRRVLRLAPGDRLTVFDDAGWEHEAVIGSLSDSRAEINILRSYRAERESSLDVALALGVTKGEKMDLVVEKVTELGAQTIVPFVSRYTVPKLNDRNFEKRAERWRRIALSATKQCGRTRIPTIAELRDFSELVRQPWTGRLKILCWERETQQTLKQLHATEPSSQTLLLVIGPEGGFSLEEADMAHQHGFRFVQLGRRILRAETAAVTALSIAQFLWGDLA